MAYPSVDELQKLLTKDVFHYAQDSKKAAGRALGTLVEVITFYLLQAWGLSESIAIERGLAEYGNPAIKHNVEYSLHPVTYRRRITLQNVQPPLTSAKLAKALCEAIPDFDQCTRSGNVLLTRAGVYRNCCVLAVNENQVHMCLIEKISKDQVVLKLVGQHKKPYAMFECKRVGIEEGNKKGPQTIEKAKQGAYVARTVSALQRVRLASGDLQAVMPRGDGSLYVKPYGEMMQEIIETSCADLLRDFVLTVGVVSNHGNWFTSGDQNKELMVLAQSYDWLLFLTDAGLAEFVQDVLIKPKPDLKPARTAFLESYPKQKKGNCFTKVQIQIEADAALQEYFATNLGKIESWFNIIAPAGQRTAVLKEQIHKLAQKDWRSILK